nr:efflux transporter outer membrane subunit [Massilia sp. JS1662]
MKITINYKFLRQLLRYGTGLSVSCVAGCAAVGPDYTAPQINVPVKWQASLPHGGSTTELLNWWTAFNDPTLIRLLQSAEADSPTLARAASAIATARADREKAEAGLLPRSSLGAGVTRTGSHRLGSAAGDPSTITTNAGAMSTTKSAALDASWEADLFGSVRRSKEGATARLEARGAEWHDARISLAAEVGNEYVNFRACQMLVRSQQSNLDSLRRTADSTRFAVENELTAPAEMTLATAGIANAAASLRAQQAECDLGVKALVALTGINEPDLRQELAAEKPDIPASPDLDVNTVPVQLLSQRPDLVASERNLAAASADIGVAEAQRYPRLSLLGSISVARTETIGIGTSTAPWSIGPSLTLPLFDGGALGAQVASARASYQAALANYQSAVRTAVKEAEQSLVRLDAVSKRSIDIANAARDYRRYFDAAEQNWKAGGISLLTLEEARRNALQAEQVDISTRRDRVLYGISLYKALGGGWQYLDNMKVAGTSQ